MNELDAGKDGARSTQERPSTDLAAAADEWDRASAADRVTAAADQRNAVVQRFPPTEWPHLILERYAPGAPSDEETFSWWLDYGTEDCGHLGGGSAKRYLVFRRPGSAGWYHEPAYGSEVEAWEAVRSGYVDLLRLAAEGRWDDVDLIESLFGAPSVRAKTAWLYHPDQLLPVYTERDLDHLLRIFDVKVDGRGLVGRNRRLLDELQQNDVFAGWQPIEISHFLATWAPSRTGPGILAADPGPGSTWDACVLRSELRVGWDDLGDLRLYEDLEALTAAYRRLWPGDTDTVAGRTCRGLQALIASDRGDLVVAYRGSTLLGKGTATGPYRWSEDRTDFRQTVPVEWSDTNARPLRAGAAALAPIGSMPAEQYRRVVAGDPDDDEQPVTAPLPAVPEVHLAAEQLLVRRGQIIFYGPPGTGKTFSALRHAVWLLAGGSAARGAARAFESPREMADLEKQFSTVPAGDERPSWLLVANPQHWSWDELFAQGTVNYRFGRLQRNYRDVQPGDEVFGYEATPTKAVIVRATIERGLHDGDDGEPCILVGAPVRVEGPSWDDLQRDDQLSQSEPVVHRMQGTLFRLEPAEAASLRTLIGDDPPAGPARAPVPQLTRVTFHPSHAYEDFVEGYKPAETDRGGLELELRDGIFKRVCRAAIADPDRRYVVVVDEINRGNVAKVLGELITLIEKDKRGVSVTLPQSGEPFRVPPNVYLIGTMNTADRSIHVLDAALRRRFGFVELLPDSSVLGGRVIGGLALDELLDGLNALIRDHVGRDKQIGHALLMDDGRPIARARDLAAAIRYEILPLLQEYVYADYRELTALLGPEIIDEEHQTPRQSVLADPERLVTALAAHLGLRGSA